MSSGWIKELSVGSHTPESEEYGVNSLVFKSGRPFHPERLVKILKGFGHLDIAGREDVDSLLHKKHESSEISDSETKSVFRGVVRSKGQVWIATYVFDWHSAGRQFKFAPNALWKAALKEAGRADVVHDYEEIAGAPTAQISESESLNGESLNNNFIEISPPHHDPVWGDRCCELVCIGAKLDKKAVLKQLEDALVTEDEFAIATEEKKNKGRFDYFRGLKDPFFGGKGPGFFMECGEGVKTVVLDKSI